MFYASICFTLFTIMAALFLLAKVRNEKLGPMYKWASYFILLVASVVLILQITRGVCRMWCYHDGCGRTEQCEGGKDGMWMKDGKMDKDCHKPMGCCAAWELTFTISERW